MKKAFSILAALSVVSLPLLTAQQQSSKSKGSDNLFDKSGDALAVTLTNCGDLNTEGYEFSPTFYQEGIVYVSYFKNGPVDLKTGKPFFELFYSEIGEGGFPRKGRGFSPTINSQAHEGPMTFSRDYDWIYFTRSNAEGGIRKPNAKGEVTMRIYEAQRGVYDWENIRPLAFSSDEYTCFHPALSPDGKRLFFSSNMPGGYGGFDLYYVQRRGDDWGKPVNLGKEVNSAANEVFPFVHESGMLFFSSDGWGGEGGLDLFMLDMSGEVWGARQHMGVPFNSPKDDLGFILNEEGTLGYLASDRDGGTGGDDIYLMESKGPLIRKDAVRLPTTVVAYDADSNERLPGVGVRIFQQSKDGILEGEDLYDLALVPSETGGELLVKLVRKSERQLDKPSLLTNVDGEVGTELEEGVSFLVLVTKDGYQSSEFSFSTAGLEGPQMLRAPLRRRACTMLYGSVSAAESGRPVSSVLVRVFNKTDETETFVRTASNGRFEACLTKGAEYVVTADKPGFVSASYPVSAEPVGSQPVELDIQLQAMDDGLVSEPLEEGSVILLEQIYYDFNQYIIRKGAARDLDALVELMRQYPSMEIELIAHTDSRGTEQYNLELSIKRAESARRYLSQRGIDENRVKVFGYGESQIRNRCVDGVDCPEEEHEYNRRTEVRIIRIDEPVKVEYKKNDPPVRGNRP
ncbi:MAG: hypothetical protein RLY31_317 [Bacteroidota bacterium]